MEREINKEKRRRSAVLLIVIMIKLVGKVHE